MKLYLYPYTSGSESAKLLAERLGALRIKLSNSTYNHKEDNLVINWGNSNCPLSGDRVLNQASAIRNTVDKLAFFRLMNAKGAGTYLPPYWTDPRDIGDHAFPVFCRTTTTGCDGAGIVIANNREELVPASLYTSYLKDTTEYRVTMFLGKVTDIQTKLPRIGEEVHPFIRTYKNGWGFQRKPVQASVELAIVAAAKRALEIAGLDFGGVDVLFGDGYATVLEVNTAMGLEGQALDRFAEAVEEYALSITPENVGLPPEPSYVNCPVQFSVPEGDPRADLFRAVFENRWKDVILQATARLV